jgi:hypothetical protein
MVSVEYGTCGSIRVSPNLIAERRGACFKDVEGIAYMLCEFSYRLRKQFDVIYQKIRDKEQCG